MLLRMALGWILNRHVYFGWWRKLKYKRLFIFSSPNHHTNWGRGYDLCDSLVAWRTIKLARLEFHDPGRWFLHDPKTEKTHWTLICMQAKTQNVWISKLSVNEDMTCDYDWFFRMSVIAVLWMNAFFHPFYCTSRSKHKRVKLRREDYAHKKAGSMHILSHPGFFSFVFACKSWTIMYFPWHSKKWT